MLAIDSRCLLAVSGCVLDGADMAMAGGSRYAFAGGNPSSTLAGLAGGLVGEGRCNLALDPETAGADAGA